MTPQLLFCYMINNKCKISGFLYGASICAIPVFFVLEWSTPKNKNLTCTIIFMLGSDPMISVTVISTS